MMSALIRPLLAVVVGILLFMLLAEASSRLVFSRLVRFDTEMWQYARQLKVTGMTPGLRFEHAPGRTAHLMGVDVSINRHGMRDRDFLPTKRSGVVRVAAIGDSITFGWGVPQDEVYARRLEQELNHLQPAGSERRFEVLNFGVGNYNTVDEHRMLRQRVFDFSPDIVLVGYFLNDAETAGRQEASWLLRNSAFAVWLWGRLDALQRRFGWKEDYGAYYAALYQRDRAGFIDMRKALQGIVLDCQERGIPVVVAMLPELHDLKNYPFLSIHATIGEVVSSSGAHFVDLLPSLDGLEASETWVSPDDAHPNSMTHARYGAYLGQKIDWASLVADDTVPDGN